jgi:histidine triad (HIT) family protein
MATEKDCIFCKIAEGKIPSKPVFENERIIAFNDINPQAPVHILVIPKKHIPGLNDVSKNDEKLLGEIQSVIRGLANANKISEDGYRVILNSGKMAGQAVEHIHYHLLGGRIFSWPPG